MNNVLNQISKFYNQRKKYLDLYQSCIEKSRENKISGNVEFFSEDYKDIDTYIANDKCLSTDDRLKNSSPSILCDMNYRALFGFKHKKENTNSIYNDNKNKSKEELFMDCVNKIHEKGWDIYNAYHNFEDGFNKKSTFTFEVIKNNFKFEVLFDNCYYGNSLKINEIYYNDKIICTNANLYKPNNLNMIIIDKFLENGYNETIEEIFYKYLILPKLFEEQGFEVSHDVPSIRDSKFTQKYAINLKYGDNSCLLGVEQGNKKYKLVLYNNKNKKHKENNSYYPKSWKLKSWKLKYDSVKDFDNLLLNVKLYFDFCDKKYGYLIDNLYFNDNNVFEEIKDNISERKLKFKITHFNKTGDEFNINIMYHPDFEIAPNTMDRINEPYYADIYNIKFWYNKNEKICHLKINSIWYNMTDVANEYYSNKNNFNVHNIKYEDGESFYCNDTFQNCLTYIKNFFSSFSLLSN